MAKPAPYHRHQAGFSLVEVLMVLAIMSVMVGALAMNWPDKTDPVSAQAAQLAAQINHAAQNGLLSNDIIAVALSTEGYALGRYEDMADAALRPWAETAVVTFSLDGAEFSLPEGEAVPLLIFEPTGGSSVFALDLRGDKTRHIIQSLGDGRVSLERLP